MSNTIERLRYFDGEYLGAYDFKAEQAYHVEMRRKLNRELHLEGIVEGLEIVEDADSFPPDAIQFSISPGFAIDRQGREIVLEQPYILANDIVLHRKGITAGTFEVWICYKENPGGLPSAGDVSCNDRSQQTRWFESFEIVLVPFPKPAVKKGVTIPDPSKECGGLRLGTVTVTDDSVNGMRIAEGKSDFRTYIGLRTQRIVAPDEKAAPFVVANKNYKPKDPPPAGYLDIRPSIFAEGNAFIEKNAVVGDDFTIDPKDVPASMPDNGNLKVGGHLFLNGSLFVNVQGRLLPMEKYVQSILPEIKFGTSLVPVIVDVSADPSSNKVGPIALTPSLPSVSTARIQAGIVGFNLKNKSNLKTWWDAALGSPIQVSVNGRVEQNALNNKEWDVFIDWTVGPKTSSPPPSILAVDSLLVSYMVVFFP